jgi:V8-like Glu-specific endopeptidase
VRPSGITEPSLTQWSPSMTSSKDNKVIYGADDREDIYDASNPFAVKLSKSVCGMMNQSDVTFNGNGTYTLNTSSYMVSGKPACASEVFADQPTIANCTAFLIGEDIIATAGHCFNSGDFSGVYFVFGFEMLDATTPVLIVDENQVYQGVEILSRQYLNSDDDDYSIIRLDRKVTSPGAFPLKIRRTGTLQYGQPIGVIGHPSGLPMKIAWGYQTQSYHTNPVAYFYANLDTYGGNSGSPVFNQETGIVEGILVRGETDYVVLSNCFVSNQINDDDAGENSGEEVQKTTRFESVIPETTGQVMFGQSAYKAGGLMEVSIFDNNAVTSTLTVELTSEMGDLETVILSDNDLDQVYTGTIPVSPASTPASIGNGAIEGNDADIVIVTYADNDSGDGFPFTFAASTTLDFVNPQLVSITPAIPYPEGILVEVESVNGTNAVLEVGTTQGLYTMQKTTEFASSHKIYLEGLEEGTDYFYQVRLIDKAENEISVDENGGQPLKARTLYWHKKIWSEDFESGFASGWTSDASTGDDTWSVQANPNASSGNNVYGMIPTKTNSQDFRLISPSLNEGHLLKFKQTYNIDPGFDSCLLELSDTTSSQWTDLNLSIIKNDYTAYMRGDLSASLSTDKAWSGGFFGPMEEVIVDLQGVDGIKKIAWHFAANSSVASGGWLLDDVELWTVSVDQPMNAGEVWTLFE